MLFKPESLVIAGGHSLFTTKVLAGFVKLHSPVTAACFLGLKANPNYFPGHYFGSVD